MVKQYRINIDGRELTALPGQTILQVARENDIFIPTLCYDDRMEIYGACGLCVVEVEGNPKLLKACATEVAPNMIVRTTSERIRESRKTNLELLLSNHVGDCRPPCAKECPAQTDCQGYVGLIAEGRYREAIELIKEKIPLPASIGRVCPHPCEKACRRGLIEEPVAIADLKRFAGDEDLNGVSYVPECEAPTGKKVAVIGAGPYGLSMAYFLRQMGHAVTVFEAMPFAGGMLRYGIPEYRLPKAVLEKEVSLIRDMGVEIRTNTKVGRDVTFEFLQNQYDAVCIGIGAWRSTGTGCEGEDLPGVMGGIDFLGKVERNEPFFMGKNVAVVGGGNTAMDACRTAVRLGAEHVYNIYRRTKDEMPAERVEIEEAQEEGVIFQNLRNPLKINAGENSRVVSVTLQVMELGEPDASGRRSPKPVAGKTEELQVDMVILAIGQKVDPSGLEGLDLTKKGSIVYDKESFMTRIPGVFAGGDCGNDKVSIAIESIADARKASGLVDAWLSGEEQKYRPEYTVKRDDISARTFEGREKLFRPEMNMHAPDERKDNFIEIVKGYTQEQARQEAARCLECGCKDYYECKLIDYANQYDVKPERIAGEIHKTEFEDEHPYILRDPNKCILCGLCVRACEEVMGVGALGFVQRGFDTVVLPALGSPLEEAGCISCGQCVSICPTGALQERLPMDKQIPLQTEETDTICGFCSMGCSVKTETCGSVAVKALPDPNGRVNQGVLCVNGKFHFSDSCRKKDQIRVPLRKKNQKFLETTYEDALVRTAESIEAVSRRYGSDAVAVAVSGHYTTEEMYLAKKLADQLQAKAFSFENRPCGLEPVLGLNASPNTIEELLSTEVILAVGFQADQNPVMRVKLMQAAKNGAKVILINPHGCEQEHMSFVTKAIFTPESPGFLKQIAKAILQSGTVSDIRGMDEFAKSLESQIVSDEAVRVAALYQNAKKAMILFQQHVASEEAVRLLADIALLTGHIGSPRDGIVMLKASNNSQGLVQLGITAGPEVLEGVKALLIFGEEPDPSLLKDIPFVMATGTHRNDTTDAADIVLPGTGAVHAYGSYINAERRFQITQKALRSEVRENWKLIRDLARTFEMDFPYKSEEDICFEMTDQLLWYRYASEGEIIGGVLVPERKKCSLQ